MYTEGFWVILPQVQDFALPCVEPHEVPVTSFFQLLKVTLDGIRLLWCISCSSSICSIRKSVEGKLYHMIQIINENVDHHWNTIDLKGMSLIIGLQLDFMSLAITSWAQPFSQFSTSLFKIKLLCYSSLIPSVALNIQTNRDNWDWLGPVFLWWNVCYVYEAYAMYSIHYNIDGSAVCVFCKHPCIFLTAIVHKTVRSQKVNSDANCE